MYSKAVSSSESIQVTSVVLPDKDKIIVSHLFLLYSSFLAFSTSPQHVTIRLWSAIPVAIWEELNESIAAHTIVNYTSEILK